MKPICWKMLKRIYVSEGEAQEIISRIIINGADTKPGKQLVCWPCRHCGGFHVGHSKRNSKGAL